MLRSNCKSLGKHVVCAAQCELLLLVIADCWSSIK